MASLTKKLDEVTTSANIATTAVPIGMVSRYPFIPFFDFVKASGEKKKRKSHPLISWDALMKEYPNSTMWYV